MQAVLYTVYIGTMIVLVPQTITVRSDSSALQQFKICLHMIT